MVKIMFCWEGECINAYVDGKKVPRDKIAEFVDEYQKPADADEYPQLWDKMRRVMIAQLTLPKEARIRFSLTDPDYFDLYGRDIRDVLDSHGTEYSHDDIYRAQQFEDVVLRQLSEEIEKKSRSVADTDMHARERR